MPVAISNDPEVRYAQAESFWRRNPGYRRAGVLGDLALSVLSLLPFGEQIAGIFAPTPAGYGQAMLDQMRWQIRSRRQPDNPWWMPMNARLVGAGLEAEAALRSGRAGEIHRPDHISWLQYLRASDRIHELLAGPSAPTGYTAPGSVDDIRATRGVGAIADGWAGASLLNRLEVALVWRPVARRTYWIAHDETIQAGKQSSTAILDQYRRDHPQEAAFGSAWAHSITLLRHLNPMAAGHIAIPFQMSFLPQFQPMDAATATTLQRWFVKLIARFDTAFRVGGGSGPAADAVTGAETGRGR